ncbi:MAG: kelch repeat-containing protein [Planctomycetota bacterium]
MTDTTWIPRCFPGVAALACLVGSALGQIAWNELGEQPVRYDSAIGLDGFGRRLIWFGGVDRHGVLHGATRAMDLVGVTGAWSQVATTNSPPPLRRHAMAWLPGLGIVLFGGQLGDGSHSDATWLFAVSDWIRLPTAVTPAPRAGHAMALDEARGVLLMYGGAPGLADTWEFDGVQWQQRLPFASPGVQVDASMAFQPLSGRVLLLPDDLGFFVTASLWRFEPALNTWFDLGALPTVGGNMTGHRLIRRPGTGGEVVMMGGVTDWPRQPVVVGGGSGGAPLTMDPVPRSGFAECYDPVNDRVYLHGGLLNGYGASSFAANVTGEFDGNGYRLLRGGPRPDARQGAAVVGDADGIGWLLGGLGNSTYEFDTEFETWRRDADRWTYVPTIAAPSPRAFHAAACDANRRRIVLFGGTTVFLGPGNPPLGDTWEWDGASWQQMLPAAAPPARTGHAMAFHRERGVVVLFGGHDGAGEVGDTWEYDGVSWVQRAPANSPSPRVGAGIAPDRVGGGLLLFGGRTGAPPVAGTWWGDTWRWDGADWRALAPAAAPAPGVWLVSDDPPRERVVAGNGVVTWDWDGATWIPRSAGAAVPTAGAGAFGGAAGVVAFWPNSETWVLAPSDPASALPYGSGCAGTQGSPTLTAAHGAWLGDPARFRIAAAPGQALVGFLGFDRTTWNGAALPADLGAIGMPGCDLLLAPWLWSPIGADWLIQVPGDPALLRLQFYLQVLVADPLANPLGAIATAGVEVRIGSK